MSFETGSAVDDKAEQEWNTGFLKFAKWVVDHKLIGRNDRTDKVVLKGNPEVGDVTWFRQAHYAPWLDKNTKTAVALYQAQILRGLVPGKFQVVFSETPWVEDKDTMDGMRKAVLHHFGAGYDLDRLTPGQLDCLYRAGADVVYSVLQPGVALKGTQSKPLHSATTLVHRITSQSPGDTRSRPLTLFARERQTTMKVREYLDQHPGSKVALLFGALHDFRFDFRRDLPLEGRVFKQFGERRRDDRPVLREVMFPRANDLVTLALHWQKRGSFSAAALLALGVVLNTPSRRLEARRAEARKVKASPSMQKSIDALLGHFLEFEQEFGDVSVDEALSDALGQEQ